MNLIACSTHALLVDSLLFAGPVVVLVLALVIVTWRERRREGGATGSAPHRLEPGRPHPA